MATPRSASSSRQPAPAVAPSIPAGASMRAAPPTKGCPAGPSTPTEVCPAARPAPATRCPGPAAPSIPAGAWTRAATPTKGCPRWNPARPAPSTPSSEDHELGGHPDLPDLNMTRRMHHHGRHGHVHRLRPGARAPAGRGRLRAPLAHQGPARLLGRRAVRPRARPGPGSHPRRPRPRAARRARARPEGVRLTSTPRPRGGTLTPMGLAAAKATSHAAARHPNTRVTGGRAQWPPHHALPAPHGAAPSSG